MLFKQALKLERNLSYSEANEKYFEASQLFQALSNKSSHENAILRGYIVSLKQDTFSESKQVTFEYADSAIRNDYYFRLACQLCAEKEFTRANELIDLYLDYSHPAVVDLKRYIDYQSLEADLAEVEIINDLVAVLLSSKDSQSDLVLELFDRTQLLTTSTVFGEIREETEKLLPSLFNKLFTSKFNEGDFKGALHLICSYDKFWTKPELLKNAGVCAYNVLQSESLILLPDIKEFISIWLSAVFNDRVLINSLDKTAWDDTYSFTLIDSMGSRGKSHGRLPSNVNYGEIGEENISIGSAQRELLNRFELMLVAKQEQGLIELESIDFYHGERAALESLIKYVDDKNFKPAPTFSIKYGLNEEIVKSLSSSYDDNKDESFLRCGIPYLANKKSSRVKLYVQALDLSNLVLERFKSGLSITKTQLDSKVASNALNSFNTLSADIETRIINAFNNFSDAEKYKKLTIDNLAYYIDSFSSNEKCKSLYARTLANFTVREVNDDRMSYLVALTLLDKAYGYVPYHQRVCQNMAFLIKALLFEYINGELRQEKKFLDILNALKSNISEELKRECYILKEAKDSIIQEFVANGNSEGLFLVMTGSYKLNAEGKKLHRVFNYFDKFSGTKSDLDSTTNLFDVF